MAEEKIEYRQGGESVYKAWLTYKETPPHNYQSVGDFLAGWNACMAMFRKIATEGVENKAKENGW